MAILDLKKKIEPYVKTATGYVKQMLSSKHVVMENGTDLETTVTELNRKLTYSSDEKQIGYTDKGEPVFRKIIYLDMTYFNKQSSGYSNLKFGAKISFDDVFSIDFVIKQNSTGIEYSLPYSGNGRFCTWLNKISHNGSESVFEFYNNIEWGNDYTMAVNIVYTKK